MVTKVDFVVAGTQKGGTSALNAYLRGHPEVCLSREKEMHFFDNEPLFAAGTVDYGLYHQHFSPQPGHRIVGEITPIYMYWMSAPKRIHRYNPQMKIVMLLRNPIDRAFSGWNMERFRHQEPMSFMEALQREKIRAGDCLPLQDRTYSYMDRGFYSKQLQRLWSFFPREQTLVFKTEDLRNHPQDVLGKICEFLGISPYRFTVAVEAGATPYEAKMDPKAREYLRNVFECEIRDLERILNWDLRDWLA